MKVVTKRMLTTISLMALPSLSFAFFCPTNFSQINFGMTVDEVTQLCGKPDMQKESQKKPDENVPQEWNYYVKQTVSLDGGHQNAQGTLKSSIAFDDKGNAINISVNGIGVGATTLCGTNIQLGDSRDKIKSACGDPAFINKPSAPSTPADAGGADQGTKVIEFYYTSATPPTTLVFEEGKLTEKK